MKESEQRLQEYSQALECQKAELKEVNIRLQDLATTDGLTGLRNHRFFQEFLENSIEQAARYNRPVSLIVADVDYFKQYNDTFGHPAGDAVLVEVGKILSAYARGADLVARYGGEEFVVVLPEANVAGAKTAAERLRATVASHKEFKRPVTISVGIATLDATSGDRITLIHNADQALYSSKQNGRNRVTHWNDFQKQTT